MNIIWLLLMVTVLHRVWTGKVRRRESEDYGCRQRLFVFLCVFHIGQTLDDMQLESEKERGKTLPEIF